jgi:hypothetical protein
MKQVFVTDDRACHTPRPFPFSRTSGKARSCSTSQGETLLVTPQGGKTKTTNGSPLQVLQDLTFHHFVIVKIFVEIAASPILIHITRRDTSSKTETPIYR